MLTRQVYLGLGSNLGDRNQYLRSAIQALSSHDEITLVTQSSVIETEPVGDTNQGDFLNMVVEVETLLSPHGLLEVCLAIEQQNGRVRGNKWAARTLDIDILLFGDSIVDEKGLKIPHPALHARGFVLLPLEELAPDVLHPCTHLSISAMARTL